MGIEINFYCLLFTDVWDVSPPSGKSYINVILENGCIVREVKRTAVQEQCFEYASWSHAAA
jgi:hypothetical protein